jgi:hypothetical protein
MTPCITANIVHGPSCQLIISFGRTAHGNRSQATVPNWQSRKCPGSPSFGRERVRGRASQERVDVFSRSAREAETIRSWELIKVYANGDGTHWQRFVETRSSIMNSALHLILVRVRSTLALTAASLRKLLGMEPHDGDFSSQRVCPFCGLITPRYETCCLECGKSFNQLDTHTAAITPTPVE